MIYDRRLSLAHKGKKVFYSRLKPSFVKPHNKKREKSHQIYFYLFVLSKTDLVETFVPAGVGVT